MARRLIIVAVAIALLGTVPRATQAQEGLESYGEGIHAFFDGKYEEALDLFGDAIADK